MKIKNFQIWLVLVLTLVLLFPKGGVLAAEFDNGYIISDNDLTDADAMSLGEIKSFLNKMNSTLQNYFAADRAGIVREAAEIIWRASLNNSINPKFLLALIQREQSLIEDQTPTQKQYDWACGYGVCDACDPDDPALDKFQGFGKQVEGAAESNRWYIENAYNGWLKRPGKTYKIDNKDVTIKNQATANLYNYTPHIKGNHNFWLIWQEWFTQNYPDGSLLQAQGEKGVWLIKGGQRRPFQSKGALMSRYNIKNIISVSKAELDKYEIGASIKFPNYSLLITPAEKVYLLDGDALRLIESKEVARAIGFNPEEYQQIDTEDVLNYEFGEPITLASAYPLGVLLQNNKTGAVFFVREGKKYPVMSKDILQVNFPKQKIMAVKPEELDQYVDAEPVKIREGELVKIDGQSAVYAVSDGKIRPFVTGMVFEKLGYKWENVRTVHWKSLSNLYLGADIDLK
ncbi:hypothetical protein A2482_00195 [Candidatus Falkowbacteria bacterium RIFOXYC2_FULL_48_21]|uniref:Curculin domain protein (Mannose-binding) lectin n=1 Tax=Candidatus Falkowbacteria bacterium RIFOXYC2_FULL_48_21 TaxID=1798005 RepID=A0A1F5TDE2_9BACT|nr:MAG: hypothetical protein A2482_00195 [Candidatus Falkowbacteria bacterium RIFOXYC2_FULL_48_21]